MVVVYVAALGVFVGIVTVRGGPSVGDAYAVTKPAAALADGNLSEAAQDSVLPQPPGYALLTAPFVLVFRPLIGSPTWCDGRVPAATRMLLPFCAPDQLATHRWYRSQGVLGILAWIVLALGCVWLLRVAGAGAGPAELILIVVLAGMPAASAGVVETFHPQDLVCVGLVCMGLGAALRRRWVATGLLFGMAFLCKQFALLPLLAVVVAVPGWRARLGVLVPVAAVVACGVIPFAVVDPSGTWNSLSAVNAGGVGMVTSGTVLGLTSLTESTKLLIARDGPVLLALAMALWARRRAGAGLLSAAPLIGLPGGPARGRSVVLELLPGGGECRVGSARLGVEAPAAVVVRVDRSDRSLGRAGGRNPDDRTRRRRGVRRRHRSSRHRTARHSGPGWHLVARLRRDSPPG
jgi:hypothetical protein